MNDQPTPADSAFTRSDKHNFSGTLLAPWTPARVIAGQSMGMLYPLIGAEGWDQFKRTKTYPGLTKDMTICLWLCSVTEDAVDEADAAPKEAYRKAKKWAEEKGILKPDSDPFWEGYRSFTAIMIEVNDSATKPAGAEEEEGDDGPNA